MTRCAHSGVRYRIVVPVTARWSPGQCRWGVLRLPKSETQEGAFVPRSGRCDPGPGQAGVAHCVILRFRNGMSRVELGKAPKQGQGRAQHGGAHP